MYTYLPAYTHNNWVSSIKPSLKYFFKKKECRVLYTHTFIYMAFKEWLNKNNILWTWFNTYLWCWELIHTPSLVNFASVIITEGLWAKSYFTYYLICNTNKRIAYLRSVWTSALSCFFFLFLIYLNIWRSCSLRQFLSSNFSMTLMLLFSQTWFCHPFSSSFSFSYIYINSKVVFLFIYY